MALGSQQDDQSYLVDSSEHNSDLAAEEKAMEDHPSGETEREGQIAQNYPWALDKVGRT